MSEKINENSIVKYLETKKEPLQKLVSSEYENGEFVRSAYLMISESRELQDCLKSEAGQNSLYNALKRGASTGLSLNPQFQEAAIIAYKKDGKHVANYQIMKNGLIRLALESSQVEGITADVVFENDKFKLTKSVRGDEYVHEIALTNRGNEIGYYAAVEMSNGKTNLKYMSAQEVVEHAKSYARSTKPGSAWNKSFSGMALKTVIKALLRNLYISKEVQRAVIADDREEAAAQVVDVVSDKGFSSEDVAADLEAERTDAEVEADEERKAIQEEPPADKPLAKHPADKSGKKAGDLF